MPTTNITKIKTKRNNLFLRVAQGHFATSHSHSNYYIDVAAQKSRLSEAKAVAQELCANYNYKVKIVDTIICLDGTEVIGTCLANELTKSNLMNINAHQTIYVVTPEIINGTQLMFRDNIVPMVKGKHVLVLAVSVATGGTVKAIFNNMENLLSSTEYDIASKSIIEKIGTTFSFFNMVNFEMFWIIPVLFLAVGFDKKRNEK